MASVLVVEDDPVIRTALIEALGAHGHTVRTTAYGFEALREITEGAPDVVVLDLGLPDLGGLDVLRMARGVSRVPILVATARDDDAEIIRLLNSGADDYLVKPYSAGQLAARIAAVLRRSQAASGPVARRDVLRVADLTIDRTARTAHLAGAELVLTRREFDLLAYLAEHADQVLSRKRILTEVWRQPYLEEPTIDVHLSALRRKLGERAARPRYLHTVRGIGIKLVSTP
ncbi:response regulator transcription factor [Streptomyces sp. NPDC051211]|uniref:response regulator transcription factor n=1 Tax=Streptomyces sp. NPDC051211 TaxID=3154643 RepID=UPI00344EA23E